MKLLFMGEEITCASAIKDESAGTATAFSDSGAVVFQAKKVTDFSLFTLEGGEWMEAETVPTTDERVSALESAMNALLNGEG